MQSGLHLVEGPAVVRDGRIRADVIVTEEDRVGDAMGAIALDHLSQARISSV